MLDSIDDDLHDALMQLAHSYPNGLAVLPDQIKGQLRRCFGDEITELLLTVVNCQPKARRKFGEGVWWTTDRAVAQATPRSVADWKARLLLPADAPANAADLCSGCGGDAMALARRGVAGTTIDAIDRDELLVAMLGRNLQSSHADCDVAAIIGDVMAAKQMSLGHLHIDPDRRPGDKRTSVPDSYSPAWRDVVDLLNHCHAGMVKLAPAAKVDTSAMDRATHSVWISLAGEVREQSLLCGDDLISRFAANGKSAVVLRGGVESVFTATESDLQAVVQRGSDIEQGQWIVDPDAAIRAAGLTEAFAARHQLSIPGKPSGYLTAPDSTNVDVWKGCTVASRVEWLGSADDRKLRKLFRGQNWYPQTIKVRGTDHDPSKLFKRYRSCGETPVTLWIGRGAKRVFAAVTV